MTKAEKAFTVMELIFVIVIVGIVVSVVIPRLATTRDDAKVAFCVGDIGTFIHDLAGYYTSQGQFSLNIKEMTNVGVYETTPITQNGSAGEYYYVCNKIKEIITPADAAVTFKFSNASDGAGNLHVNLNATMASVTQGSVDGDLGHLLKVKHVASDGLGVNHSLAGIRVKR